MRCLIAAESSARCPFKRYPQYKHPRGRVEILDRVSFRVSLKGSVRVSIRGFYKAGFKGIYKGFYQAGFLSIALLPS